MKIITELLFCVALYSFQPTHWVQEPSDLANNDLIAQSFVQVVSDSKVDVQIMQKDSFIECLEENSCISGDMEKRRSHPLPVFSPSRILMKSTNTPVMSLMGFGKADALRKHHCKNLLSKTVQGIQNIVKMAWLGR